MRTLEHPMKAPPIVPGGVQKPYVDQGNDLHKLVERRLRVCVEIAQLAKDLEPQRLEWLASLHPDVRTVIGHIHGPLLRELLLRVRHEDSEYFASLSSGRCALGDIGAAGIYKPALKDAKTSLSQWLADGPARNRKIIAAVTPSCDDLLDNLAWSKREKEIESGSVQGPYRIQDVDLNTIAVHPRFAVWERGSSGQWKARNIDNLKASGGNDTVRMHECIRHVIWTMRELLFVFAGNSGGQEPNCMASLRITQVRSGNLRFTQFRFNLCGQLFIIQYGR